MKIKKEVCTVCARRVGVKEGKIVRHRTKRGPSNKKQNNVCKGSGKTG
jgi:hypothetical protein